MGAMPNPIQPRILQVRTKILKKNDETARRMRDRFLNAGVFVVNLVSSPGTGKTSLLKATLKQLLDERVTAGAIVGDLETDNDARRLSESGAPVRQIMTHGMCHLEADMIEAHLQGWNLDEMSYLFIENVGNLVCPSSWDLGESLRVALLSVAEGEDKPLKYPGLFNTSDLVLLTKMDLAEACEFNRQEAHRNIQTVRPGIQVLETSSKKGEGLDAWIALLKSKRGEIVKC
jgi:hydrogenase nickel incorporation protein HypB